MNNPQIFAAPELSNDPFNAALLALLCGGVAAPAACGRVDPSVSDLSIAPSPFSIPAGHSLIVGGSKAKFAANLRAIEIIKACELEGRTATHAERLELVRYVGWGGLQKAFRRADGHAAGGWENEVSALESLLDADELDQARASTTDAFYTPRDVVEAVYAGLERLGFQGGRVIDPAVGTGHFIGLAPAALREAMRFTTVELDGLSASITAALYPEVRLAVRGFQDFTVRPGSYDAAVGNPPFGTLMPFDALNQDLRGFTIHNYFVAKCLRAVAPGGIVAMVVSRHMLDKERSKERAWMTKRARLLGAIRLPNTTFAAGAGTSVTADLVFLQRLASGEHGNPDAWSGLGSVADAHGGDDIAVNRYFADHPHMMLGQMVRESNQYSADEPTLAALPGPDLQAQLAAAITHLPQGVAVAPLSAQDGASPAFPAETADTTLWSHFIASDATIWQRVPGLDDEIKAQPVDVTGRDYQRMRALIELRDDMRSLMAAESADESAATIAVRRATLNASYDAFVGSFGYLNAQANVALFRDDADAYMLRALEADYQRLDATAAQRAGVPLPKGRSSVEVCTKATILRERVLFPQRAPHPETARDALAVSLNLFGRIDPASMADMLGIGWDAIETELGDLIFQRPDDLEWVPSDEYLSGNVKQALAKAKAGAANHPRFMRNVRALENVQPDDVLPGSIYVAVGSPWVPADVYESFAKAVLGLDDARVTHSAALGRFVLTGYSHGHARFGTQAMFTRGLFAKALNREPVILTTLIDGVRYVTDHDATEAARQAVDLIGESFLGWVWNDPDRRERLTRIYNDTFNTDVPRRYDGSHLTFPGKVSDAVIRLRRTQVNAVWRMIRDGVTLLDHSVGAGKTYTLIAALMEQRRMGLLRKPLITVPNALVCQWALEVVRLYPAARVLAVTEQDFTKDRRLMLFARIATGDWDMVIVAHSQFSRLGVPQQFELDYLREQVDQFAIGLRDLKDAGADNRSIKQVEAAKKALQERLKGKLASISRDNRTATLDDMGIDCLAVDESQMHKNLGFTTRKRNVSGLGDPKGSQRAEDLYMKVRWLQTTRSHAAVYFLTGTPISNSLVEMFTMQRYLATDVLRERGIAHFDCWANNYAEESVSFELDSSAQGLKAKTVLKRFRNIPELLAIYKRFADTVTLADLMQMFQETTGKPWPVPKLETGKPINVVVPAGPALMDYIQQDIIPRMQAVCGERGERPDPSVDNMLKITNDARLCALDVRLRLPGAEDDPGSKVNRAVRNIVALHRKWADRRGTQLVFCDLSTPTGAVAAQRAELEALQVRAAMDDDEAIKTLSELGPDVMLSMSSSFSVYDDLKAKLVASGVDAHEIAFIHDAHTDQQRRVLFDRMNRGDLRILVGSTAKMGTGMNVQARIIALHHLDTPFRPSDLTQREGRLLRQGNHFYNLDPDGFTVAIYRYCTERTYDSRMWQLIERKSACIDQLRSGDNGLREVDDIVDQTACASELKAACTGNPLIIEQVELEASIKRLSMLQRAHLNHLYDAERSIAALERDGGPKARHERAVAKAERAEAHLATHPRRPFTATVGNTVFTEFKDGANAITSQVVKRINGSLDRYSELSGIIGVYRGTTLTIDGYKFTPTLCLSIPGAIGDIGQVDVPIKEDGTISSLSIMSRLDAHIDRLGRLRADADAIFARDERRLADMRDLAGQPFRAEAELSACKERLNVVMAKLITAHAPATTATVTVQMASNDSATNDLVAA